MLWNLISITSFRITNLMIFLFNKFFSNGNCGEEHCNIKYDSKLYLFALVKSSAGLRVAFVFVGPGRVSIYLHILSSDLRDFSIRLFFHDHCICLLDFSPKLPDFKFFVLQMEPQAIGDIRGLRASNCFSWRIHYLTHFIHIAHLSSATSCKPNIEQYRYRLGFAFGS